MSVEFKDFLDCSSPPKSEINAGKQSRHAANARNTMAIITLLNIVNIGMIDNIRTLKPRMSVMPLAKSAEPVWPIIWDTHAAKPCPGYRARCSRMPCVT